VDHASIFQGGTKFRTKTLLLVATLIMVAATVLKAVNEDNGRKDEAAAIITNSAASAASVAGPRIHFAEPMHDFGKIKHGEAVKYTYIFTNIGDRLLEVTAVRTSCGCTTAGEWSRQVEPCKSGNIPVQFNSGNYDGPVGKSITVTCNDTNQPTVVLQIKATIWKPIEVTPQHVFLNVTADAPSTATTVRIVNNENAPLTMSLPEVSNSAFAVELRTNQPGKEFQLIVKTVPPLPAGSVQGQITLKTSSTNMPVINVGVQANVQQDVTVMPFQIQLPAAPLANPMPSTIVIRNNGMNALALSEPAMNAKDVKVQLKEIQAGRSFTVTLTFPAGFEIAQGEKVELSVKSNHPQLPLIKVPVIQPQRPAPSAVHLKTPTLPAAGSK
jgi:hypothetical protein